MLDNSGSHIFFCREAMNGMLATTFFISGKLSYYFAVLKLLLDTRDRA